MRWLHRVTFVVTVVNYLICLTLVYSVLHNIHRFNKVVSTQSDICSRTEKTHTSFSNVSYNSHKSQVTKSFIEGFIYRTNNTLKVLLKNAASLLRRIQKNPHDRLLRNHVLLTFKRSRLLQTSKIIC